MESKKSRLKGLRFKFFVFPLLLAIVYFFSNPASFEFLGIDILFSLRGNIQPDPKVVIVELTEADIQYLGFPIPRDQLGLLHGILTEAGAELIGYDMLFNPFRFDSEGDIDFARINYLCGNAVQSAALHITGKSEYSGVSEVDTLPGFEYFFYSLDNGSTASFWNASGINSLPYDSLLSSAVALGHISIDNTNDGIFRKVPLFVRYENKYLPSLGFLMSDAVWDTENIIDFDKKDMILTIRGIEGKPDFRIKTDATGSVILNYYGTYSDYPRHSFAEIVNLFYEAKYDSLENLFFGKTVIIGHSSNMVGDYGPTTFDNFAPLAITHATLASNLNQKNYLVSAGAFKQIVFVIIVLGMGLLLQQINKISLVLAGTFVLMIFTLLYAYYEFSFNFLWLQYFQVSGAVLLLTVSVQSFRFFISEKEKRKLQSAFIQYVPEPFVKKIIEKPELLKLGGDKQELTVIFSDLAGFTGIAERLTPELMVELLNEYLDKMTDIIMKYGGTLDKYIGDAIMAFWGAPIPMNDHADRACQCVLEMIDRLNVLRKKWNSEGRPDIFARYGINTGNVVVGNIGSKKRFNYTIIGDPVNLGARLEPANKAFGTTVMVSEFTLARTSGEYYTRLLDKLVVKGKKDPVRVYELIKIKDSSAPDPIIEEQIKIYNEGLEFYYARKWQEAIETFSKLTVPDEDDGPAYTYINRCIAYQIEPPPDEWDGVFFMKTK